MYMLIPMNLIILGNYVYVDSTGFLNACKLCVDSTGFLNACKLCICWFQWNLIILETMYMLILLGFWMLVNYVYADSNG